MGLVDLLKPKKKDVERTQSALEAARTGQTQDPNVIDKLVNRLLALGLDGAGPIDSATEVAEAARKKTGGDPEKAVRKVARKALLGGGVGGFVTGLGGFVTMPVAIPVNVLEFYTQAIRMTGAIASLRGYDVKDPTVRTAVLLTLIGSNSDEVLKKAGIATGGGRVASLALRNLPPGALLVVNKAIGFKLLSGLGEKAFARLGRGIPVVGGVVGAGFDGWMMKKIADHAMKEFPVLRAETRASTGIS